MPKDRDERAAWRKAAGAVERYRDAWGISDPADALRDPPAGAPPEQREQHQAALAAVEAYARTSEPDRTRARDTGEDLELDC